MTAAAAAAAIVDPKTRPLFLADWTDAVFIHFRLPPSALQPFIPLSLDLHDGHAIVSLVAFAQRRLRPTIGGRLAALLATPLASHPFFNVRTYVRAGDARGIFFIAEWIPNRLAAAIGPRTYGLPYRLGRLHYRHDPRAGHVRGCVTAVTGQRFAYRFDASDLPPLTTTTPDTLDHFLLERYTAFTHRHGVTRRFDVAHAPWPHVRLPAPDLLATDLLPLSGPWPAAAEFAAAHYSPGVTDVTISPPLSPFPLARRVQ